MIPTKIELRITAISPLIHGSFGPKVGNATPFRRIETPKGPTPAISGNALGGILRRIVWRHAFDAAGLSRETVEARAWDRLYGALANGGHLEKSEVATNPDRLRSLRRTLPPLSAFGAAMYSYMLAGNASFPFLLPEGDDPELLTEEVNLARHVDREQQDPEVSGVTPMPTTFETLRVGTILTGSVLWLARPYTTAEVGCVVWALDQLVTIGGKAHTGFGRISVDHDGDRSTTQAFLDWCQAPETADALRALAAELA